MITLVLTPEEAGVLNDVLETRVRELTREIAHADSHAYRDALRKRAELLEDVIRRVARAPATTA